MKGLIAAYFKKLCSKKRKGSGLLECVLLIIIMVFMLRGILETSVASTSLQQRGIQYVNSHKSAVSFFDKLEAVDVGLWSGMTSDNILTEIEKFAPVDTRFIVSSDVTRDAGSDLVTVMITVNESYNSTRVFERTFNTISNERVSDDREK